MKDTVYLIIYTFIREEFDWEVYVEPFCNGIWLTLAVSALVGSIIFRLTWIGKKKESRWSSLEELIFIPSTCWSIVCCYLGKSLSGDSARSRLVIFSVGLCGVVVWSAYRASLTSVLAVRTVRMPFDSLEGLLASEFQ